MSNVYVSLVGGVGNQLFQIAAGYVYARTYNKNLILDTSRWTGSQGKHPDTYKNSLFRNFMYSSHHPRGFTEVFEKRYNFDPLPYYKGDVRLNGYFQSFKYFEHYKDDFLALLSWPDVSLADINPNSVAIHIRRGDYIQHQAIHLICVDEYYRDAAKHFENAEFNVFTDDLRSVYESFSKNDYLGSKAKLVQGATELDDLYLLGQHDNIICSNSSFSWWGSLIGKKKEKIIVPDLWYKNFENHDDIYRSDFTRIAI